jgi:enolase
MYAASQLRGMHIDRLQLRTIYNSRVNRTVEAVVNDGRAAAPRGASTGSHEAHCHVPDNLATVEQLLQDAAVGSDLSQQEFDQVLRSVDGTDSFQAIGAAAIAASLAFRKAAGSTYDDPVFPYPAGNLVGGGAHGGTTQIQEFLVIPTAANSIPAAMQTLADIYHDFRDRYGQRITGINDEGAYVTNMNDEQTLDAVSTVAADHGASVGIDAAATEFYDDDAAEYRYPELDLSMPPAQQRKFMATLIDRHDLVYVEDPFHEDDFEQTAQLTDAVQDCLVVGDDLFTTDTDRLQDGIAIGAGDAIIIKPNQVGTVSDTRATLELTQQHDYTPIISHRSGETCDPVIADLAVAWGTPLIKAGIAGIRTAKNNQLVRLWDRLDGAMADLPV